MTAQPNPASASASVTSSPSPSQVEILILGAGWTSTFLIPLLAAQKISHAATTTTGRDGTYRFKFTFPPSSSPDRDDDDEGGNGAQYRALPTAKTVLITFPLRGAAQTAALVDAYVHSHSHVSVNFVQLGSTGIWTVPGQERWVTRRSRYDAADARGQAEDELLRRGGSVLDLAGLWGGERNAIHWIDRVAPTKEVLKGKGSLHMVHGVDVARAIVAVHRDFGKAAGERWMLTDLQVYDWWSLVLGFAGELDAQNDNDERAKKQIQWIGELMEEENVRALPRDMETLGRCYDTREFWKTFGIMPTRSRISSVVIGGQY
ncbi:uncharacterized protein L3040_002911 [Drepanopeziza brunnea f. sp. 'multigermtubi']|uniref:uncharacterized protein n=1 Tax=Drepanopeziza brunnea f. sp. 'multigermtubi' TaxID=698441 RepID=UPI00238AF710|nr:hypothetical protein L3040_002911 [Drepanopeziza brunnea f. sp. 'multigermtubi']